MTMTDGAHTAGPVIAVFFEQPDFDDYPFHDQEFRESYAGIAAAITARGARFFIVRDEKTYLGNGRFSGGWGFVGGEWKRQDAPVACDVIWNKDYFRDAAANVVNDPRFDDFCKDKGATYTSYNPYCPRTIIVHGDGDIAWALDALSTNMVVAKPVDGGMGKDVVIAPKDQIRSAVKKFPFILQEFIDTSGGIPGIVEGHHDFRIFSIGGTIVSSYIRTPPEGSLVANVSKGGKEITVPIQKIPAEALEIYRVVDRSLEEFPTRFYSLDMGRDASGRWFIIELNSKPGAPNPFAAEEYDRYVKAVADLLVSAAR